MDKNGTISLRKSVNSNVMQKCFTAQKMKFSVNDFFNKFDQIHRKLKSFMENLIFCAVFMMLKYSSSSIT